MIFSLLTVTYNAARHLEQTITNILSQTYPGIEYIIIDGGSTDGTVDIIRRYESGVAYWVSEPDKGLYDAMNKGLAKASGDYVWFINAGDTLYSTDTVRQVADLIKGAALPDVIYGETMIIGKDGSPLGLRRLKAPERLTWKNFRMGMLVCHQSFLVKKAIAPLYDTQYRLIADYDWCIRCLQKAGNIYNTHLILANFLEDGLSSANRKESLKERYKVMNTYYGKGSTALLHIWFAVRFYSAKWIKGRV